MNRFLSFFVCILPFFTAFQGAAQNPNCPPLIQVGDTSLNNAQYWNASYFWDPTLEMYDLCEGPANLSISSTDTCVGANLTFRYQLLLDLNQDGVLETIIDSQQLPPADTVYVGNNDGDGDLMDGVARRFDFRPVPVAEKWQFGLQDSLNPATGVRTGALAWHNAANPNVYVAPELPHGKHKIKWFVPDGCGNEQICESNVELRDVKAPVVSCKSNLMVNLYWFSCVVPMEASTVLLATMDNCTPVDKIQLGIRKKWMGTGFPVDWNGLPNQKISLGANDGQRKVELWSKDAAGNANYCETEIFVMDNAGACDPSYTSPLGGQITTENGAGLGKVNILIPTTYFFMFPIEIMDITNPAGFYGYEPGVPWQQNCSIIPSYDLNPLNGVSTYDLVLISKHILGIEPLNSPYKMLAADANHSGSITTFDIVELRKLILGVYDTLPNNTSWRFVDKRYVFPDTLNPFSAPVPEMVTLNNVHWDSIYNFDFIGYKIGDVNNSAIPNLLSEADDRTPLPLHCENKYLKAGESVEVPFFSTENILGAQFTLEHDGLTLEEVLPGKNLNEDNFAFFGDLLTFSNEKPGAFDFVLRFKAEADGYVSEKLRLSSKKTANEAYLGQNGERRKMSLAFTGGPEFSLFQNQPNPFSAETSISFNLPEDMEISLYVSDQNGKTLWEKTAAYSKGLNTETIQATQLPGQGLYTCSMRSAKGNFVRKMVKMK